MGHQAVTDAEGGRVKKLVTTVQFVLDVVHAEDVAPIDVARVAVDIAHDAMWRNKVPIAIVSASALATRTYVEGETLCDGVEEEYGVS